MSKKKKKVNEEQSVIVESMGQNSKRERPKRNVLSVPSNKHVTFKAWFINKMDKEKRIREYHFDQIRLYMVGLGLHETEEAHKYDLALKRYFGD